MLSRSAWMSGKAGVMMHYLPPCPEGRDGSRFETVDACVECFNIPAFLEQFDRIGAEWLIFTIGQNTGMYNAPCEVIEKLAGPGHCAKRDLVGELALALHRAGKHFIAYLPMEAHANPIRRQLGWIPDSPEHPVSPQRAFQKNWLEVVAEWSLRYGRLIDGWFFDGGYCLIQTRAERTALFAAARAGNSDAAVSLNYGGFDIWDVPLIFEDEDYFSGEATMLKNGLPLAHWRDRSTLTAGELGLPASEGAHPVSQPYCPGRASVPGFPGVLMHALVPVDSFWYRKADVAWLKDHPDSRYLQNAAAVLPKGEMEFPMYSEAELAGLLYAFTSVGGAVTLNLGCFADGSFGCETRDTVVKAFQRTFSKKLYRKQQNGSMDYPY